MTNDVIVDVVIYVPVFEAYQVSGIGMIIYSVVNVISAYFDGLGSAQKDARVTTIIHLAVSDPSVGRNPEPDIIGEPGPKCVVEFYVLDTATLDIGIFAGEGAIATIIVVKRLDESNGSPNYAVDLDNLPESRIPLTVGLFTSARIGGIIV
jgi:hypothetical protein